MGFVLKEGSKEEMSEITDVTDLDAIQTRTRQCLRDACHADSPVLIEAPPISGKSTSSYELTIDDSIDTPISLFTARTDLYEEAEEWVAEQEADISYTVVPSPFRLCPTFLNENRGDSDEVKRLYNKGLSGYDIHQADPEIAYTPCVVDGCEFMEKRRQVLYNSDEFDLIIGNHQHSHVSAYVDNRIVIFDEYNADPFIDKFLADTENSDGLQVGEVIADFLTQINDAETDFPTDRFTDVTDILTKRNTWGEIQPAIEWFRDQGVGQSDVEDYGFHEITSHPYDSAHLLAPMLTLALFCMRQLGPGIELTPPSDCGEDVSRVREAWLEITDRGHRCIRDRDTGMMQILRPPDLSGAEQVIGLDALPVRELWDIVFAPDEGFEHKQVIPREDFPDYLDSVLNMTLYQIGYGMHPYAAGRVSRKDGQRFELVYNYANQRFPLITTKQARDFYDRIGLIDEYVKETPRLCEDRQTVSEQIDSDELEGVRNYATVLSSNAFGCEDVGVVSGMPFPGDDIVKYWAGLCGHHVAAEGSGENKSFGEFGDKIYRHFAHHQVVQAILRFGRHECVWRNNGADVFINTKALPDWFEVDWTVAGSNVRPEPKRKQIINHLIKSSLDDNELIPYQTVATLAEAVDEDVSNQHIRDVLDELVEDDLVEVRENYGSGSADQFRWRDIQDLINLEAGYALPLVSQNRFLIFDS